MHTLIIFGIVLGSAVAAIALAAGAVWALRLLDHLTEEDDWPYGD